MQYVVRAAMHLLQTEKQKNQGVAIVQRADINSDKELKQHRKEEQVKIPPP